jgi:GxxExxY protein
LPSGDIAVTVICKSFSVKNEHVTGEIISASLRVHSLLGPGLLESAYRLCLAYELKQRGLQVQSEIPVSVNYDGLVIDVGYRIDLLVEAYVIVELKTVRKLMPVHHAQLLSYLRMSKLPTGLLINFHVARLRDGIKRIAN